MEYRSFFKEAKQLLNLGKNESQDFDSQIADTTITMIQYIFLAVRNGIEKYESLGKIYENTKAETLEIKLHDRLILLLIAVIEIIEELYEDTKFSYCVLAPVTNLVYQAFV